MTRAKFIWNGGYRSTDIDIGFIPRVGELVTLPSPGTPSHAKVKEVEYFFSVNFMNDDTSTVHIYLDD